MNFYKLSRKNFSFKYSFLKSEFNFTKQEIKLLNNEMKRPWVRPGWDKLVGLWFLGAAGITLGMITLGGYVRLNKAGLSMVRWDLLRIKTPKTNQEWEKEFLEYKEHPQYKIDFPDLSVDGFKFIYLLEHYHRQLGKILGIFFIIPSLIFTLTRVFNKKLMIRSLLISLTIATQGVIGMWMVRSGLKENLGANHNENDVRVSHYRLATHFTFGVTTYWLLLNSALFLLTKPRTLVTDFAYLHSNSIIRKNLVLTIHLVLFTAIFGSLTAGQNAGKIANTFPKMGDIWYPTKAHYEEKLSLLANNFENKFLVHFNHRVLATVTLSTILLQTIKILGLGNIYSGALRGFIAVTFCTMMQFYLGVLSVLNSVPVKLAHLHQFCGIMTISACIFTISLSRKVKPHEMQILLRKLFEKDSQKLSSYMTHFKALHPKTYEKYIQKDFEVVNSINTCTTASLEKN